MELKRLIANDSKSALQCVRDECGDDALIVSTNKVGKKTEVIYAIDISEKDPEEDFRKTQADTARFSDALGEIKNRQNNESSDVRNLLGQIQRELGTLKQKIDAQQRGFQNPEIKAPSKASDLALRSIKTRVEKLIETPLEKQKSWSGIQLFAGTAFSGKKPALSALPLIGNKPLIPSNQAHMPSSI
jgi:flagellar biosynthesis GTPase FlhF